MKPTSRQLAVRLAAVVVAAVLLLLSWRLFWDRPPAVVEGQVDLAYVVDSQLLVARLTFTNQTANPGRVDCGLQVFDTLAGYETSQVSLGFGSVNFPVELGANATVSLWQPIVIYDAEAARVRHWNLACPPSPLYAPAREGVFVASGQCRDSGRPGSQLARDRELTPTSKLTRYCYPD